MRDLVKNKHNLHIYGDTSSTQTLMFAHGFGTDQTSFDELVKPFEKHFRIIVYDNVGGGKSDSSFFNTYRYNTLNGYVTDLLDICKYLELKNVSFIGHSVNGMVGLLASQKMPDAFSKLVLLGASPRYLNDSQQEYVGGFNQDDLDGLYEAMHSNYFAWVSGFSKAAMNNPDKPHLSAHFAASLKAIRPDIALSVVKAIFQSDHRKDLPKTVVPTLVVQTAEDIAVPDAVGTYLHQHITNSKLVKIKTKGHFPQISGPDEIAGVLKSFIYS